MWLALRRRWSDGTTHLTFNPVDLLGRLAVLIPRPRVNLVLSYGVLAPRAPWRTAVVGPGGCDSATACDRGASGGEASGLSRARRPGPYLWADLLRRTFGFDVLACPRCGGRLRLLALIEHASTVDRILRHLGLPTAVAEPRPARPARKPSSRPTSPGTTPPRPEPAAWRPALVLVCPGPSSRLSRALTGPRVEL